jgi:hypothetical protein
MRVVFGSAFRNSTRNGQIQRYLDQVRSFMFLDSPVTSVRVIAVEGDSKDHTHDELIRLSSLMGVKLDVTTCNHGGPVFGSTEEPARLAALSKVGNCIFDQVTDTDDVLVYVESDLQWRPKAILQLVVNAVDRTDGFDVFAPAVLAGQCFYDIWGFRYPNGARFSPFEKTMGLGITELSSVGSCLVMRRDVAKVCRIRNDYALVGWCEDARQQGFKIAMNPSTIVRQL